jgi:hypothetical protein
MKLSCVVFALGVLTGTALAASPPKPKDYTSEGGGYSVQFPGSSVKVEDDKAPVATSAGNLKVVTAKCESNGVIYSVTYTDYPDTFGVVSTKEVLDGVVAGMKGSDGTVKATDITESEVSGRAVTVTAGDNLVRGKVFLDGRRLYLVMACGKKGAVQPAADKFLDSFAFSR